MPPFFSRRATGLASSHVLPSNLGNDDDPVPTDIQKAVTVTPEGRRTASSEDHLPVFSSPPGDTQALSQFVYPPRAFADDVEDEAAEGVWGYLIPLDDTVGQSLVLKKRNNCEGGSCVGRATETSKCPGGRQMTIAYSLSTGVRQG